MTSYLVLVLIMYVYTYNVSGALNIVNTSNGPVKGIYIEDVFAKFYSYRGIPYAESPTGDLRFMPPVPKTSWTEEFDATKEPPVCPQSEGIYTKEQMSEDCLRLNIHVPGNRTGELPVMIYISGGEFKKLSSNDDYQVGPQFYIQRNIIVASVNYRLGALGFLSLQTKKASGNAALKDILLAMKWINKNIQRFGGDPKRITLSGNSAGSALVHHLTLSKQSTGLFQQATLISGSALGFRNFAKNPVEIAFTLARELNITANQKTSVISQLKKVDVFDIIDAQDSIEKTDIRRAFRAHSLFVPCVERNYSDAIITKDPRDILLEGLPQNVPVLVGFNAQEGIKQLPTIIKSPSLVENLNNNFELCIPSDIEYPYGSNQSVELADNIRDFYLNGQNITIETLTDFLKLVTDSQFVYSIDAWINYHKQNKNSNSVYYYLFSFHGELNWFEIVNEVTYNGTSHADELGYHFVTKDSKPRLGNLDDRTKNMLNVFITTFTNFIKYGNPSSNYVEVEDCGTDRNYLLLSEEPIFECGPPYEERTKFWYNVYNDYYQYVDKGGRLEKKFP